MNNQTIVIIIRPLARQLMIHSFILLQSIDLIYTGSELCKLSQLKYLNYVMMMPHGSGHCSFQPEIIDQIRAIRLLIVRTCPCVRVFVWKLTYIYMHTHTHTHTLKIHCYGHFFLPISEWVWSNLLKLVNIYIYKVSDDIIISIIVMCHCCDVRPIDHIDKHKLIAV